MTRIINGQEMLSNHLVHLVAYGRYNDVFKLPILSLVAISANPLCQQNIFLFLIN